MTERHCCDGKCEQGRVCPLTQQHLDDDNLFYWADRVTDAFAIIGFVIVLFFTLGLLIG